MKTDKRKRATPTNKKKTVIISHTAASSASSSTDIYCPRNSKRKTKDIAALPRKVPHQRGGPKKQKISTSIEATDAPT